MKFRNSWNYLYFRKMINNNNEFKNIYAKYAVFVYNISLNYLQNTEDAEEITQDVFIQLNDSLSKFKYNSTLKTWVYRITINKCLDFIKYKNSQKRWYIYGNKSNNEKEILNFSNFDHPGIILENQENAAVLFQIINQLSENQKTAFILSKVEELNNSEIAAIMELSISSVESLIFRAKVNLREKLSVLFKNYRKK